MNDLDEKIDDVLNKIDFARIKSVIDFFDFGGNSEETTIYSLVKFADKMLRNCYKDFEKTGQVCTSSCGGFFVIVYDNGEIRLSFEIESSL